MNATSSPLGAAPARHPAAREPQGAPAVQEAPATPADAVERLAGERATGALRGPAGTVYLAAGQVVHAESDRAPDLAALLTGCGRITPEAWQEILRVHGPRCRVGDALVEQGRLTRGELELCHLGALYDAAFFVLDATAGPWRFEPGVRHWLGPVTAVGAHRLRREVERRRQLLERIWPWPQLDTEPVRPSEAGIPESREACAGPGARGRHRRSPSRRQRELLDHADGRRTPGELARLLGHSAFATTADVRRLAAAGLLATPGCGTPGRGGPRHAAPSGGTTPDRSPADRSSSDRSPADRAAPGRTAGGLHRRVPGATLTGPAQAGPVRAAHPPTTAAAHPLTAPDPDIALLTRVLTLLEARL
ncbi:hypothetical protein [Kitasatospora sp. NPDC088351]|uniref:DUF4388 domain-containing protein n=1 Tax=Kitasatospora sp. NPDC088351 TaxID=3155180 RepID=UPI00342C2D52